MHLTTEPRQPATSNNNNCIGCTVNVFTKQGSHSFTDKKIQDFSWTVQDPMRNFPGPFRSLRMFKYKKNGIYSQYSERSPLQKIQHEAKCGRQPFRIPMNLFTYGLSLYTCSDCRSGLEKRMPFDDIFSRTFRDQSDFPFCPGIFKKKIQDFPELSRRRGNPDKVHSQQQQTVSESTHTLRQ